MTTEPISEDDIARSDRFLRRRPFMGVRGDIADVARQIQGLLKGGDRSRLQSYLSEIYPADLADAMFFLTDIQDQQVFDLLDSEEAAEVLDEVDDETEARLVGATPPERLADILEELPPDEGADIVGALPAAEAEHVLGLSDVETAEEIRRLLVFPRDSAGGIMSTGFVAVPAAATQEEALRLFREDVDAENLFFVYVVDERGALLGSLDLRRLLVARPDATMGDIMTKDILHVTPEVDQEQVARVFARYDLTALPVVEPEPSSRLIGVITADDIIDVIQEEHTEDVMQMAGSDADELEKRSPAQIAMLRLPWIMATMFIELLAGFVIHVFDRTLTRIILLASFMPIISAISGNTGLQSATIIVRGLSTGHIQLSQWRHAVLRQVETTLILGAACGLTLGVIGALWDHHWSFGLVVFIGMFAAVNIAGIVGTLVPLLSKRLGFDPALTAGPFETAFQDVVGISIFLSLASLLLRSLR